MCSRMQAPQGDVHYRACCKPFRAIAHHLDKLAVKYATTGQLHLVYVDESLTQRVIRQPR
jgi:hypothetical protein